MRPIKRPTLPRNVAKGLRERRVRANSRRREGRLDPEREWKRARQSRCLGDVVAVLRRMCGPLERCMYCLDSHGTDVDHFWPKSVYPRRLFFWANLMWCCTECGRLKGAQFPREDRVNLLIDPTKEDPWAHLDFDPVTGNLTARFSRTDGCYSKKGQSTVAVLQLDRREALAEVYRRNWKRLCETVRRHLAAAAPVGDSLVAELVGQDDFGLLAWCVGIGRSEGPFPELRVQQPAVWDRLVAAAGRVN